MVVSNIVYFHPYLWKIPILTNVIQTIFIKTILPKNSTWNLEMMGFQVRNLQTSKGPPFSASMFVLGSVVDFSDFSGVVGVSLYFEPMIYALNHIESMSSRILSKAQLKF